MLLLCVKAIYTFSASEVTTLWRYTNLLIIIIIIIIHFKSCPQTLKFHSPVSLDPLNARSLRSLGFPKSPPLKILDLPMSHSMPVACNHPRAAPMTGSDRNRLRHFLTSAVDAAITCIWVPLVVQACAHLSLSLPGGGRR